MNKNKKICSVNQRIRELLEIKNITQNDLSEATNMSKSNISLYVNDKRKPQVHAITAICDAYNLNSNWLIGYDVPMHRTFIDSVIKALPNDIEAKQKVMINNIIEIALTLDERGLETLLHDAKSQSEIMLKFKKPNALSEESYNYFSIGAVKKLP